MAYLDSGATSQKPLQVLDAERDYLTTSNGAVHRGAHQLMEESTDAYEGAGERHRGLRRRRRRRARVHQERHRGAQPRGLRVWKRDSAVSSVRARTRRRDRRHRDGAPRQPHPVAGASPRAPERRCASSRSTTTAPRAGLARCSTSARKVVAFSHVRTCSARSPRSSGWSPRAHGRRRADRARRLPVGAAPAGRRARPRRRLRRVLRPQDARPHRHRRALRAARELLDAMPPFLTGGSMIETVTMEGVDVRRRRRSGSRRARRRSSQAVGLGAAVEYLTDARHGRASPRTSRPLTGYALDGLSAHPGVRSSVRRRVPRAAAVAFVVDGVHAHDVGQVLDDARGRRAGRPPLRAGRCTAGSASRRPTRASFAVYNTLDEVDALVDGVDRVPARCSACLTVRRWTRCTRR